MKYSNTTTMIITALFTITTLSSAHSSSSSKAISDASGRACTSIVLLDRTIPYDLCFNTLTKSKSADLNSLARAALSQAQLRTKGIVNRLKVLKDDADGEDKLVDSYRACLAGYSRLNGYVSAAWDIVSGKTYGDAKRNLRSAIASARSSVDKCEKLFTGAGGRPSPISRVVDKEVESLVKIAVKILNMMH